MAASYTYDVFSTLDGFANYSGGNWGGYWGKQGPELEAHRLASYSEKQRMVFGANTYRQFVECWPSATRTPRCVTPGHQGVKIEHDRVGGGCRPHLGESRRDNGWLRVGLVGFR
jgi:hypothetical protein